MLGYNFLKKYKEDMKMDEDKKQLPKKLNEWMLLNVVDDVEENIEIGRLAQRKLLSEFNIGFEFPETVIATYGSIYQTIMKMLKEKQSDAPVYGIRIKDLEIGYDDAEDDGVMEKVGSFCPYICEVPEDELTENTSIDKDGTNSVERCTQWMSNNMQQRANFVNQVSTQALKNLAEDVDIHPAYSVIIFPIFYTIHQQMVEYLKLKRIENNSTEERITFAGMIKTFIRMDENTDVFVEYSPVVSDKWGMKEDSKATGVHEL